MPERMADFFCVISRFFQLQIQMSEQHTQMTMTLPASCINTTSFPQTYTLLYHHLPSVLDTTCFNDLSLPFQEEVKHTELGHLFEHILLEYLCQEKVKTGAEYATYHGETSWNWKKDPRGVFHIDVSVGRAERLLLQLGIRKSCYLIETILASSPTSHQQTQMAVKPSVLQKGTAFPVYFP